MDFLENFLDRTEFSSYEDFKANFKIKVPENFNFVYDVVDRIASEDPNRRALVWCNDAGEEHIFSMADIAHESAKIAHWLKSIGIGKGDAVLLILRRHYHYWNMLMALHRIGAIPIPATNLLQPHDIAYRVKEASVKMIVAAHDQHVFDSVTTAMATEPVKFLVGTGGELPEGWINLDDAVASFPTEFARPTGADALHNDDAMIAYFTSGTSGNPKIVRHNFLYPLGHIVTARYWHGCQPGGLHLTVAETGWAKAAWGKLYGQWLSGSAVMAYDMDKFHADKVLAVVQKYGVTTFCAPPTVFRFLIQEDLTKYDWSSVRRVTTAGEALNPEVYNRFKEWTGLELCEGYGQTETALLVGNFLWGSPKPGSMGRPSAGFDIDVVNSEGASCGPGEEGEIVIRTGTGAFPCGLLDGYGMSQKLRESAAWKDGIYLTGDVGWKDEDGYLWYVGRDDDVIKSSGYRIGPFEVESALMEHPAVVECAITGVQDPKGERGIVVKATVVLAPGYNRDEAMVKELQTHVKRTTAPYKYPRVVEFVDELPKTISGKIRRSELRKNSK